MLWSFLQERQPRLQMCRLGQPGQFALVAGTKPAQVGVNPVGQRGALIDELLPVVHQHPKLGRQPVHRPHRRQRRLPGGDPGDRHRIDRVGLALPGPGLPLPGGHQRRHLHHGRAGGDQVHRGGPAEVGRPLDPDPHDRVLGDKRGQDAEADGLVGHLPDGDHSPGGVDHRHRERVLVTVNSCEHPNLRFGIDRCRAERRHLKGPRWRPHASIERHPPGREPPPGGTRSTEPQPESRAAKGRAFPTAARTPNDAGARLIKPEVQEV